MKQVLLPAMLLLCLSGQAQELRKYETPKGTVIVENDKYIGTIKNKRHSGKHFELSATASYVGHQNNSKYWYGAMYAPPGSHNVENYSISRNSSNPRFTAKLSTYVSKRVNIGVQVSGMEVSYQGTGRTSGYQMYFRLSSPLYQYCAFGNYNIKVHKMYIFAGASIGGYGISGKRDVGKNDEVNGWCGGIEAGVKYPIVKNLFVNAQVDYSIITEHIKGTGIGAGLSFKF